MATRFQQLGAYVAEAQNLTKETLSEFHRIGGRFIMPIISQVGYPHDHDPQCVRNRAFLPLLKSWCEQFSPRIEVGGWFMCWAKDAYWDAQEIEMYVRSYNLKPISLNCELAYKEQPEEFPKLLLEYRKRIRTLSTFLSVIDLNDSMIWNGGRFGHTSCTRYLQMRASPQWYSAPRYAGSPWFNPKLNLAWLKANGDRPGTNFYCGLVPGHRAMPNSWVKGTLEVTGLEGASLEASLISLFTAKGDKLYDYGISVYTLDSMPASDFELLSRYRGKLYLV